MKKILCLLIATIIIMAFSINVFAYNHSRLEKVFPPIDEYRTLYIWKRVTTIYSLIKSQGREDEYYDFIHNFDNGIYQKWEDGQRFTMEYIYKVPYNYKVLQGLNISREDLIYAAEIQAQELTAGENPDQIITIEQIDALYSNDIEKIQRAFKYESAYMFDGLVYPFDEIFIFDIESLLLMRDEGGLVEHLRNVVSLEQSGVCTGPTYLTEEKIQQAIELANFLENYPDNAPQTGIDTFAYTAVAVVALAAVAVVVRKRRIV